MLCPEALRVCWPTRILFRADLNRCFLRWGRWLSLSRELLRHLVVYRSLLGSSIPEINDNVQYRVFCPNNKVNPSSKLPTYWANCRISLWNVVTHFIWGHYHRRLITHAMCFVSGASFKTHRYHINFHYLVFKLKTQVLSHYILISVAYIYIYYSWLSTNLIARTDLPLTVVVTRITVYLIRWSNLFPENSFLHFHFIVQWIEW